jgi:dihydrofolate synthase/folylpolyglutamate synthase
VRSRAAQDIAQALTLQGVTASVHADVASALRAQLAKSEAGDQILLLGSFYTVTEAILWLRQQGVDVE